MSQKKSFLNSVLFFWDTLYDVTLIRKTTLIKAKSSTNQLTYLCGEYNFNIIFAIKIVLKISVIVCKSYNLI